MNNTYELHPTGDQLTANHWQQLHAAITRHSSALERYDIVFSCQDGTIRYFIACSRNIVGPANGIDGLLLRSVPAAEFQLPDTGRREAAVHITAGENLVDLKHRHRIKRGSDLTYVRFNVQPLGRHVTLTRYELYFSHPSGVWSVARRLATLLPATLLAIRFGKYSSIRKQSLPRYLGLSKSMHMLDSQPTGALFKVQTFPYVSDDRYLHLTAYDFDKHSLIVGASGSGKSKLISLLVNRLYDTTLKLQYRVIVIDPHASLAADFAAIPSQRVVTFGAEDGAELFPGAETDLSSAVELTATLFRSILEDQFNPRLDRLLRFSLFSLMTAQTMSLEHLKRFITDSQYRNDIMDHVQHYVPDNVYKFFGTDFNELRSQYYESTIMPLVTMIDEMQLQPSLVSRSETSLAKLVQDNFLTVFSLNRISMGDKTLKTVAGLLIQQIFLLAQSRVFGQKIILVIDEVSVVQNPALAQILAEARKFNLTIILTQQYFGQIDQALREAIFANVYNYYMFKVSEADATALAGNVSMDIPPELLTAEQAKGVTQSQLKAKIMTEQSPRDCLVRVMSNGQLGPCIQARTVDAPATPSQVAQPLRPADRRLPLQYVDKPKPTASPAPSETPNIAPAGRSFGGLGDLLRQHSSSRINLKNRKN